ncbi:hypothetical protein BAUCODRAFT_121097 [Baudoinia panamericana UAMH 10762]|uniref:Myb-like domain-containing protein n=1 Tax=Baudoinia panamericana (strain UAMH 10762) TaxID=717646 RepID=M2N2P4_BAUPA|nr:uncharacterized protein BAUCODRAFT_121097 [Baudoinia panamericana UAMH 10762]EMC98213.1 hypothetical protein BAUCODRAFT_121097 [Baudoinia panamericana UAMH 10762]
MYKPTSLHVINLPNPVEPQSVPQKHPLNGTAPRAPGRTSNVVRLLHCDNALTPEERPAKRRRSGDAQSLNLPKLPVRHAQKRLRIPPTLSGLHQPPPDAGLLPSISTAQPVQPLESSIADRRQDDPIEEASGPVAGAVSVGEAQAIAKPVHSSKKHRWSPDETSCLLQGVARFGVGSWTKILQHPEYHFDRRTALDLKDRFRVIRPDDYRELRGQQKPLDPQTPRVVAKPTKTRPTRSAQKSNVELETLGIVEPFARSKRRRRHGYSRAEDEALLQGFEKYGNQWAQIREDGDLHLSHRTATDLRDRMRTKYPEQYQTAGLAPRPTVFPKPPKRGADHGGTNTDEPAVSASAARVDKLAEPPKEPVMTKAIPTAMQSRAFFLPDEDVFFGLPFEADDRREKEPVTLDRGILAYAASDHNLKVPATAGIDPRVTLNVPLKLAKSGGSALPSLAAMTSFDGQSSIADQLELPSLMLGPSEDGRTGGHLLGIDELLT